jgi:hypothetical protein
MTLDETYKNRDYLFGRLWAIAELACKERYGNSDVLHNMCYLDYQNYPSETWKEIVINPKFRFLMTGKYGRITAEVMDLFDHDDFIKVEKLGNEFLAGYTCQKGEGIKDPSFSDLGRKGGSTKTAVKTAAARENGKKGGRPKKQPE